MSWLLDTNVFLQAARREYGFDFCPAFWDWLAEAGETGRVLSTAKVLAELTPGDAVGDWAAQHASLFHPLQPMDGAALGQVADWARSGEYTATAAQGFLDAADSHLVAVALARGWTVVTHEVPSNSKQRIKIPTACVALRVSFANPYEMLRKERARFVLGKAT